VEGKGLGSSASFVVESVERIFEYAKTGITELLCSLAVLICHVQNENLF